jgi:proteic killer suppression protein
MEIEFRDESLKSLYEGKIPNEKQFKSNPDLVRQYIKTVRKLYDLTKFEQISQLKSLHYEKLQRDLKGKSAVRINDQYRLIFEEIAEKEPPYKVVLLALEKISKHYEN